MQMPPLILPIEFSFAPFASTPAILRRKLWLIKQCFETLDQFSWVPRLEQQTRLPIEDGLRESLQASGDHGQARRGHLERAARKRVPTARWDNPAVTAWIDLGNV